MTSPSWNSRHSNWTITQFADDGADHCQRIQRRSKKIPASKSGTPSKLSTISLEEYMNVFYRLTDGKGMVVQPNCNAKSFSCEQLKSVLRLHNVACWKKTKEQMLLSLAGIELWNPYTFPLGSVQPGDITDEEMIEALRVLRW